MSVELANLATDQLGVGPLRTLEDKNKTADVIRRQLEQSTEWVLRRRLWTEMLTTENVVAMTNVSEFPQGFKYAYNLPDGFVRAYRIWYGDRCYYFGDDWRITNVRTEIGRKRALITRIADPLLEFTWRPDNLMALPNDVRAVLVTHLAKNSAMPLKVNKSLRKDADVEYEKALMDAAYVSDSQDTEEINMEGGDIIEARGTLWGGVYGGRY